ncbi:MAG: carboxylesterase/lipase family protein [Acidimicrobiales bacterium]|nr:carboxylesterase/lipase family protein [Acidimicrobiales bacterium]
MVNSSPVATTTSGPVFGRERDGVLSFAGIPYAAPPVGHNRFGPPQPVEAWSEPRDATRFTKGAPQRPGDGLTSAAALPWDEAECLSLNVQTPAVDGARPVMVWIHGGDFRHGMGAIPWYNGARFAEQGDVVVVSINYRLGAFGFTYLDHLDDELAGSGVVGILDQLAALQWVQDNIASFGGDPERVTIAGESAGAFSVGTLLSLPAAQPLFAQAILQSGAAHAVHDAEQGQGVARWLFEAAGVASGSVEGLRSLGAERLLDAQEELYGRSPAELGLMNSPFYPVVDGVVLPRRPIDAIAAGVGCDKPVLMGTNADETRLWGTQQTTDDRLEGFVARTHPDPAAAIDRYREAGRATSAGDLAVAIGGDAMFGVPAVRMADARAAHGADTWMYRFSWQSRAFEGALGACHALEIPFVFDNLHQPGVDLFIGPGPDPQPVADIMHATWISFLRHGRPGFDGGPEWLAYSPEQRSLIDFDTTTTWRPDPVIDTIDCWSGVR